MIKDIYDRRYGRFIIRFQILNDNNIQIIQDIMSNVIVLRCEQRFMEGGFEYEAASMLFRPLKKHEAMPTYNIVAYKNENNNIFKWEFEEIE